MISAEERRLREDLGRLAAFDQGRRLLQLSLRGIARGEREVTAGCWAERGIAGCLFQHAYWEGVREGIFADKGRPGDWIGSFAGPHEYGNVIRAIESFDRLARKEYAAVEPRTLLPDLVRIRQPEWNSAVEALLVDALGQGAAEASTRTDEVHVSA